MVKLARKDHIDFLEGVRGYLALWVMVVHILELAAIHPSGKIARRLFNIFLVQGAVPVGLFMALSGFVIFVLLERKNEPYPTFIARRIFRLFPAYIVVFIASVLVSVSADYTIVLRLLPWADDPWIMNQVEVSKLHREYLWENIAAHITLLHGLVPKYLWPNATDAILGVAWSISTEWQFYLLAPVCFRLCKARTKLATLTIITLGLFTIFSILGRGQMFANPMPAIIFFYVQYFFMGAASFFFWLRVESSSSRIDPLPVLCFGSASVLFLLINEPVFGIWIFLICSLYITKDPNCASPVSNALRWTFCNPAILFIGRISYSLYLIHFLIGGLCLHVVTWLAAWPIGFQKGVFCFATMSLSLVMASIMYRYVELPFLALSKRILIPQPSSLRGRN